MRFAVEHAVAVGVVIAVIVAFSAASYFALLAWAVLVGERLGGPLAFSFMVLFALAASVVSVGVALFPVTAVTELVCVRRGMRVLWQIPIGIVFLVLLVPLVLYWWSVQSADWVLGVTVRWRQSWRAENTVG